ncbi:MAG: nitronate monooxygenase [Acidobacteria bacterium]|nr:nitronate monooxygenase [Acidobacteriota bacterium]
MRTRVTDMLKIDHPIVQGGMMWVAQPELVAAVSNGGGLGIMAALTFGDAKGLEKAIARTRQLTDRPFGVNLTFLPTLIPKDYGSLIDVIVGEGIPVVETAGQNPEPWLDRIKAGGALVIHKCTAIRHAKKAESIGCDIISIDGFECAGHPGEDDVTSLILTPLAASQLTVPVIASGGFADGRGLAAALALGAEGINMGTRFMATAESPIHPAVKQKLVEMNETETILLLRSLRNTERVWRNTLAERVASMEREGAGIEQLAPLISGKNGLRLLSEGELEAGLLPVGQSVGLISDIPAVAELIGRTVTQAHELLATRLPSLLA